MHGARARQWTIAGAGVLALLLSAGCSFNFSAGGTSVDKETVAQEAAKELEAQVGQTPDDVTCPEDLPGEVGASIRCELTAGGETLGVTVTTTEVDGSNVNFDIEVDG